MEEQKEKPEEKKTKTQSLLDEAKAEREALEKVRDEARSEREKLEELKSEQMLSGSAGGRVEPPKDERTPKEKAKEYADNIMRGKLPEGE